MQIGICSFSFHRTLGAGKQDMFKYITDCKELGATQLDPWNAHLTISTPLGEFEKSVKAKADLEHTALSSEANAYLDEVKAAAQDAGLPFGCIAVDGAHMYEAAPEAWRTNRATAYMWLEVAAKLGAPQVRMDAGGPEEMPDDAFKVIVDGYHDVVARAKSKGIEVLIENHWGPSRIPENAVKILDAVPGLGLLFDTNNWAEGMQEKGWEMCAKYARAIHIKTFVFDEHGDELTVDIPKAMRILRNAGYNDAWGIESCPKDGDEYRGVANTIALIKRVLGE